MMRIIGKKIVAVLMPSGVAAGLMLGSLDTANAAVNYDGTPSANINGPCNALPAPAKANVPSILALVNVGVQDIPILGQPCSTNSKGDEPLSHIQDQIPVLSGGG